MAFCDPLDANNRVRLVKSGQIYRQMFEAEVQLTNTMKQYQTGTLMDFKTKQLEPEIELLHDEKLNEFEERDEDKKTVCFLPDIWKTDKKEHMKKKVEKILENDKEKKKIILERLEKNMEYIGEKAEMEVEKGSSLMLRKLKKSHATSHKIIQHIPSHLINITAYENVWRDVETEECKRARFLEEYEQLINLVEARRLEQLQCMFDDTSEELLKIKEPKEEVERIINAEILAVDKIILANKRAYELISSNIKNNEVYLREELWQKWRDSVCEWKKDKIESAIIFFKEIMEKTNKKALLPSEEILRQVVKKQAEINQERIAVLYRLRDVRFGDFSMETFKEIENSLVTLTTNIDNLYEHNYLCVCRSFEETHKSCLLQFNNIKSELMITKVCNEEEANDHFVMVCHPLLMTQKKAFEDIVENLDGCVNKLTKATVKKSEVLLNWMKESLDVWFKNKLDINKDFHEYFTKLEDSKMQQIQVLKEKQKELVLMTDELRQANENKLQEILNNIEKWIEKDQLKYNEVFESLNRKAEEFLEIVFKRAENCMEIIVKHFSVNKEEKIFLLGGKEVDENEILINNENEMGSLKASRSEQRFVLYESPDGYEYWLNVEADEILKEIRGFELDSNNWDFKLDSRKGSVSSIFEPNLEINKDPKSEITGTKAIKMKNSKLRGNNSLNSQNKNMSNSKPDNLSNNNDKHSPSKDSLQLSDNNFEENVKSQQDKEETDNSIEQLTTTSKTTSSSHEVLEQKAFEAFTMLWSYLKDYVDMVEIPFGDFENVYLQFLSQAVEDVDIYCNLLKTDAKLKIQLKLNDLANERDLVSKHNQKKLPDIKKRVYDIRMEELSMHKTRIEDHTKAVEEKVTNLKMHFNVMFTEQESVIREYQNDFKNLIDCAEASCHSTRTEELLIRAKVVHCKIMRKLRKSLRDYVCCIDQVLRGSQKNNEAYKRSLKLFIEGGNYNADEVDFHKTKLEAVKEMLLCNEDSMMSEVEKLELIWYEQTLKTLVEFQKKYEDKKMDQIFCEESQRILDQLYSKIHYEIDKTYKHFQAIKEAFEAISVTNDEDDDDDADFSSNGDNKSELSVREKNKNDNPKNQNVTNQKMKVQKNTNSNKNNSNMNNKKSKILSSSANSVSSSKSQEILLSESNDCSNNEKMEIKDADKFICTKNSKRLINGLKRVDESMREFAKTMSFDDEARFINVEFPQPLTELSSKQKMQLASFPTYEELTRATKAGSPLYQDPIVTLISNMQKEKNDSPPTSALSRNSQKTESSTISQAKKYNKKDKKSIGKIKEEKEKNEEKNASKFLTSGSEFEIDSQKVISIYQEKIILLAENYYNKKGFRSVIACGQFIKENLDDFKLSFKETNIKCIENLIHQHHLILHKDFKETFLSMDQAYSRVFHFIVESFCKTNLKCFKSYHEQNFQLFNTKLLGFLAYRESLKRELRPALGLPCNQEKLSHLCKCQRSNSVKTTNLFAVYINTTVDDLVDVSSRFVNQLAQFLQNIFNDIDEHFCFNGKPNEHNSTMPGLKVNVLCDNLVKELIKKRSENVITINKEGNSRMTQISNEVEKESDGKQETKKEEYLNNESQEKFTSEDEITLSSISYCSSKENESVDVLTDELYYKRFAPIHASLYSLCCSFHEKFSIEINKSLLEVKNKYDSFLMDDDKWNQYWNYSVNCIKAIHL